MQSDPVIDFRRERDFGDVINVTFAFLRQNLVPLGKSLLYLVGPVALLTGLLGVGLADLFSFDAADPDTIADIDWAGFIVFYFALIVAGMLTWVLAITVVLGYIILYQDRGPETFDVSDVWKIVVRRFWMMLRTTVLLLLIVFFGYIILMVPMVIIFTAGASTGSAVLGGILFFFGFLAFIAALIYYSVIYALVYPIQMRESLGLINAIRRSHYLVKGHWWGTFLVFILSLVLMTVLGLLFNMPGYILSFMGGLHGILDAGASWMRYPLLLGMIVGTLGSSLLYAIPLVASATQYFSLVEYKEQTGLMERIDEITDTGRDPSRGEDDAFPV